MQFIKLKDLLANIEKYMTTLQITRLSSKSSRASYLSLSAIPREKREGEAAMSTGGAEKVSSGGGSVKTPADFLKSIRGRPVVVKLNSGVDYRGRCPFFPSHLLLAWELEIPHSCVRICFFLGDLVHYPSCLLV